MTLAEKPTITASADRSAATVNSIVTYTASVKNTRGSVKYQWQRSANGNSWSSTYLGGYDTATLSFAANEDRLNYQYRVAVTDDNGTWYSSGVTIKYIVEPTITATVNKNAFVVNENVIFSGSLKNTAGSVSYQWMRSTDGITWTDTTLSGYNTNTLSFSATEQRLSYNYRLAVTDANGIWYSNSVSAKYVIEPTVTVSVDKTSAREGETVTLTASTKNIVGTAKYQWWKSTDGITWTETTLTGYNSNKLSFSATELRLSYQYRIAVTDDNGTWYGKGIKVNYIPSAAVTLPKVTTSPALSISSGTITPYQTSNGNLTISWSTTGGNGVYNVAAIIIDETPLFDGSTTANNQKNNAKATILNNENFTGTSFTVNTAQMAKGKYLKVAIGAKDQNFSLNGEVKWMVFGIGFSSVSAPTIKANGTTLTPQQVQNYDLANGNLTLSWSGSADHYLVTVGHINEAPLFGSVEGASTQVSTSTAMTVNGNKLWRWSTTTTSITIPVSSLQAGKNLKIAVAAVDHTGAEAWTVTGLMPRSAIPQPTTDEITSRAVPIIITQEGGYASVNPDDHDANHEHGAVSVGQLQWHGNRALSLVKTIINADPSGALSILGSDFYKEIINASSWANTYFDTNNSSDAAKVQKLKSLLGTQVSKNAQEALKYTDVKGYITGGQNLGMKDANALIYYADLTNQYGAGGSANDNGSWQFASRAATTAGGYDKITLDILHQTVLNRTSNYLARRNRVYTAICGLVWQDTVYITKITLSSSAQTIGINGTNQNCQQTVTYEPSNATNQSVTWSSGNTSIATVDSSTGIVTGVAGGSTTIIATAADGSGKTASYTVYVVGTPTIKVGSTTVMASTSTTWNTSDALTIRWSGTSANRYLYKIITLNEKPAANQEQGANATVATVVNQTTASTNTSYSLTAAELANYAKSAKYLKIWVQALNSNDTAHGPSAWIGVELQGSTVLPAPSSVSAVVTEQDGSTVKVTWSSITNNNGYRVYYSDSSTWTNSTSYKTASKNATNYSIANTGKGYYFWVAAVDSSGNLGEVSSSTYIPTSTVKAVTVSGHASRSLEPHDASTKLTISWSKPSNTNGTYQYKVLGMTQAPNFDSNSDTGTVIASSDGTTSTSFSVTASKMSGYSYLKIAIAAEDTNYSTNKACSWLVFGISLTNDPDPEFLTAISVSGGTYAGDTYTMTFDTSTSVSYIVVCYESGSTIKEKADKFYAYTYGNTTSDKISWSIPYQFEHTGDSDTRTVILRCYSSGGDYETKTSKSFTCKANEASPTVSIVSVTPSSVPNNASSYFTINFKATNASTFTIKFDSLYAMEKWNYEQGYISSGKKTWSYDGATDISSAYGYSYDSTNANLYFYPQSGTSAGAYSFTLTATGNGGSKSVTGSIKVTDANSYYGSAAVSARMDELYDLLGGGYFTVNRKSCTSSFESGHSCSNCFNENVIKETWFKNIFGTVNYTSFPASSGYTQNGWSCLGFAHFAAYWIYRDPSNPSATVTSSKIGTYTFNQSNATAYAQTGDLIRFDSSHSAICYYSDGNGMYVLDCNYGTDGTQCRVAKHYIAYSKYSKFTINRCDNAE